MDDSITNSDVIGSKAISEATPGPVKEGRVMGQSAYASTSCSRDQVVSQMTGPAGLKKAVSHTVTMALVARSLSVKQHQGLWKKVVLRGKVFMPVLSATKQIYDKTHHCIFCGVQIRNKISRHLINDETWWNMMKQSSEKSCFCQNVVLCEEQSYKTGKWGKFQTRCWCDSERSRWNCCRKTRTHEVSHWIHCMWVL